MARTRRTRAPLQARLALTLTTLLAGLAVPDTALAWHDDGHRIVAEIARRHLSSEAKERVDALLADLPAYATMAEAATWPDQRPREDPAFQFVGSSHYVNVDQPMTPRELLQLCLSKSGCVATAIGYYQEVLRSQRASPPQRAEALRFLIHFIGDVHQPLHAGHSYDRGGNDIDDLGVLEYRNLGAARTNLHAAWDGGLIAITMARQGWSWREYALELDGRVDEEMIERWGRGSAYDWIEESRLFAAANGYLHADGITPIEAGDELGEDWYAHNLCVAEQRLQQGGIRLALVLDEIF